MRWMVRVIDRRGMGVVKCVVQLWCVRTRQWCLRRRSVENSAKQAMHALAASSDLFVHWGGWVGLGRTNERTNGRGVSQPGVSQQSAHTWGGMAPSALNNIVPRTRTQ